MPGLGARLGASAGARSLMRTCGCAARLSRTGDGPANLDQPGASRSDPRCPRARRCACGLGCVGYRGVNTAARLPREAAVMIGYPRGSAGVDGVSRPAGDESPTSSAPRAAARGRPTRGAARSKDRHLPRDPPVPRTAPALPAAPPPLRCASRRRPATPSAGAGALGAAGQARRPVMAGMAPSARADRAGSPAPGGSRASAGCGARPPSPPPRR